MSTFQTRDLRVLAASFLAESADIRIKRRSRSGLGGTSLLRKCIENLVRVLETDFQHLFARGRRCHGSLMI